MYLSQTAKQRAAGATGLRGTEPQRPLMYWGWKCICITPSLNVNPLGCLLLRPGTGLTKSANPDLSHEEAGHAVSAFERSEKRQDDTPGVTAVGNVRFPVCAEVLGHG